MANPVSPALPGPCPSRGRELAGGSVRAVHRQRPWQRRRISAQQASRFPRAYLATVRAGDRSTEFHQRCVGLGIKGVSLHSYRYAWAERAKTAGYPERFAQMALGHNSKAVHRAYAKKAQVTLPPLEEYERKIVPLNPGNAVSRGQDSQEQPAPAINA